MLDLDKPVEIVLNDGAIYPARIICRDIRGDEPIVVEWGDCGFVATFRADGSSKLGSALRNRKVNRAAWFAVGIRAGQPYTSIHATEEDAKKWAADFYPALTASIEWEV